jgi:hypothetical protein
LTESAVNVVFVPLQIVSSVTEIITPGCTFGLTVNVSVFEVAGLPETHDAELVITQFIWSELMSELSEYVLLLLPVFIPFFFH